MSKQKHLTISDRFYIEQELLQKTSFKTIALTLHKDPTTISKEIQNKRKPVAGKHYSGKCLSCKYWRDCTVHGGDYETILCERSDFCSKSCRRCWKYNPANFCKGYVALKCDCINKFPYVCNSCPSESECRLNHYIYDARHAQKQYELLLSQSRAGINLTPEELQELNSCMQKNSLQLFGPACISGKKH